ncbi:MAG: glycosyltransferase, partial [Fimbriimonadaceae bacterium]
MKPKVICLLPVRNAAADLPGFFSSAVHFADAVISLDDGSTDETPQLLRSHPLVIKVLSNPRRSDFTGWDDAANRNALLAAASEFQPDWIISVDADERIPDDDALALKRFLEHDAIPGVAYGFRCYSMAGDLSHALRNPIWVYRLFAYLPGLRFPDQALHFAPIPTSIPRRAFLRTTFRIQHLGGMSSERRLARYEKYRQVDPECRFWPDYSSLLAESTVDQLMEWPARNRETPVFFASDLHSDGGTFADVGIDETGPVLAVVVVDDGPIEAVHHAISSAKTAGTHHDVEVIIVSSRESDLGGDDRVRWMTVDKDVRSVARRNIGLNAARAANVLFVDSTLRLEPSSIPALCEAHLTGYAIVSGRIECDRSNQLALTAHRVRFGKGSGETGAGILARVPRWASYRRSLLLEAGGFDEADPAGAELLMARRLETLGYLSYSIGEPVARFHIDDHIKTRSPLHKAFQLGRAEARFTMSQFRDRGALFGGEAIRSSLPGFMSREKQNDGTRSPLGRPQEARNGLIDLAKLTGETTELLRPGRNKALLLFGHPAGIALV